MYCNVYPKQACETLAVDLRGHGTPLIAPETTSHGNMMDLSQPHDDSSPSTASVSSATAGGLPMGLGSGARFSGGCRRDDISTLTKSRPSFKPGRAARTLQDDRVAVAIGQVCGAREK